MISIIIPIYNQADKLPNCLESILKQTYKNYEVIVVNDCSKDDVRSVMLRYQPKMGLKYRELDKNCGAPAARNVGYQVSEGSYLFFCDADAVLEPTALEDLLNALKNNPKVSFAYSNFYWGKKKFRIGAFDCNKLKTGPLIHTMSLIRREDFPTAGWDENIKKFQDWDLYLQMLKENKIGIWVDKFLFTVKPGGTISKWMPSFVYKWLPFLPAVKKYKKAEKIIKGKWGL